MLSVDYRCWNENFFFFKQGKPFRFSSIVTTLLCSCLFNEIGFNHILLLFSLIDEISMKFGIMPNDCNKIFIKFSLKNFFLWLNLLLLLNKFLVVDLIRLYWKFMYDIILVSLWSLWRHLLTYALTWSSIDWLMIVEDIPWKCCWRFFEVHFPQNRHLLSWGFFLLFLDTRSLFSSIRLPFLLSLSFIKTIFPAYICTIYWANNLPFTWSMQCLSSSYPN